MPLLLADGEVRARTHPGGQRCHQTSYQDIVNRRGTQAYEIPGGGVVNDYVPFYFSPITAFAYTICRQNVPLIAPNGVQLGMACEDDRVFLVARAQSFVRTTGLRICFSDYALNSSAPTPKLESDLGRLEEHVHWGVFDEDPRTAHVPEIGYAGVCRYFLNKASPAERQTRSEKRMAEFLVHSAVPLTMIDCIIAKTDQVGDKLKAMMNASAWNIPVYVKRGCYFT